MNELHPDVIPYEFGLPFAGLLIILLVLIELRAKKKKRDRNNASH